MGLAQGGSFISLVRGINFFLIFFYIIKTLVHMQIEIFCFLFILVRALFVDCINLAAPKRR